jgi:hypothetical protein
MQEWQTRVVIELKELDAKIKALEQFIINSTEFKNINEFERQRLRDQHDAMTRYAQILHSRITHF